MNYDLGRVVIIDIYNVTSMLAAKNRHSNYPT